MTEGPGTQPHTPTDPAVYRAHIDTGFTVDASSGAVVLRLAGVDDRGVTSGVRQFSLFFHGAPDAVLRQGTYLLRHDVLGAVLLFIAPIQGSTRERILYEACFNVLVDAPGL